MRKVKPIVCGAKLGDVINSIEFLWTNFEIQTNGRTGKTYLYEYDNAGNITAVKTCYLAIESETPTVISTNTYSYSTGSWGDLLTSYKGTAITYDEIGNPISYYNHYCGGG